MVSLTRWDPFRDFAVMENEMNRLFNNAFSMANTLFDGGSSFWTPELDVWETEDEYIVAVNLPGIEPDAVDVTLVNDTLTIQGELPQSAPQGQMRLCERPYGKFYRAIRLPQTVDDSHIEANYYNGVLSLHLPKAEDAKPKRITVHSNGHTLANNGQRTIDVKAS